jgi:hypothetical protein
MLQLGSVPPKVPQKTDETDSRLAQQAFLAFELLKSDDGELVTVSQAFLQTQHEGKSDVSPNPASPTRQYFVSPAGSDAAAGTEGALLRSIQAGADRAIPGDEIDSRPVEEPRWFVGMFGACALTYAADNTTSLAGTFDGATLNTCTRGSALVLARELSNQRMRGFLNMGLGYSMGPGGAYEMGAGRLIYNGSCNKNVLSSANVYNCGGHSGLQLGWRTVVNDTIAAIGPALRNGSIHGVFLGVSPYHGL